MDALMQVGLGYIKVGQQATTLSGGEAQRVKLSKELSRRSTGARCIFWMNRPRGCISKMCASFWKCCMNWSSRAIRWW
jgi:excinuclease UvrABC ATPase subunit